MATGAIKRGLQIGKVVIEKTQSAGADLQFFVSDIETAFNANYSGTIVDIIPIGNPQPQTNWNSYAQIMWDNSNNNKFNAHVFGTGTQAFKQMFDVFYK